MQRGGADGRRQVTPSGGARGGERDSGGGVTAMKVA